MLMVKTLMETARPENGGIGMDADIFIKGDVAQIEGEYLALGEAIITKVMDLKDQECAIEFSKHFSEDLNKLAKVLVLKLQEVLNNEEN